MPREMRTWFLPLALLTSTAVCALSGATAQAADHGLYTQVGLGYGSFGGNELWTKEDPAQGGDIPAVGDECCPKSGLSFDLRFGYKAFKIGGPEFTFSGEGWGLGAENGGGGFIGGGFRIFPLGIAETAANFVLSIPLDFNFGFNYGWSVVGDDFAYSGNFWGFDLVLDYGLTESFRLGAKFLYLKPSYGNFQFTDYNGDLGRCLDESGLPQLPDGSLAPIVPKNAASCGGNGPDADFLGIQLLATFDIPLSE